MATKKKRMTQTAFRLVPQDFQILDEVRKRMGFSARSTAVRYILRQYAKQEKIPIKT